MTKCIALLLAAGMSLAAQTSSEKARKTIDAAVAALGGDRFLNLQDRIEYGRAYSFYNDRLSGLSKARITVRYLSGPAAPGMPAIEEQQSFGKKLDSGMIFANGKGWSYSFRGARPVPEEVLKRWADSTLRNVFYILRYRLKEPGLVLEHRGAEVYENQPIEIVDIIDADNRTVTVYFHASTHLPVRQLYFRRDAKTKERNEEITIFSKYRDVGSGVQLPMAIERNRNGEKIYEAFAESITLNNRVTTDTFQVDGRMKILPPAK